MNKNMLIGAVLVVLVLVGGYYYFAKSKTGSLYSTPTVSAPTATSPSSALTANKEVTVTASEFKFTPASLSLKKGDVVKVTFVNGGTTAHSFTIDEFGVLIGPVSPGQSDTATFAVNQTGTFNYFCNVDGHRGFGMQGSLKVQ